MKRTTLALSAALAAALGAPLANAVTIVPAAGYATGFVTAVNAQAGTIVVDGTTIKVTPAQLDEATLGTEVDVAYIRDGGLKALVVSPIEAGEDDELVE
jgi:hypothetical protein